MHSWLRILNQQCGGVAVAAKTELKSAYASEKAYDIQAILCFHRNHSRATA